jgi:PQQ-like domain
LSAEQALIIVPASDGTIAALDTNTGAMVWQTHVPVPEGQQTQLVATPAQIGNRLVVVYQCLKKGVRISHRLAVLDISQQQWDNSFPNLTLTAQKPTADGTAIVTFNPATAFSHAAVKHTRPAGSHWGLVYIGFGNAGDEQPFHGWLFEIDLDAWQAKGVSGAIKNVLLTTPEATCPVTMPYGTQEMVCGGGIWAPSGPQILHDDDTLDVLVPTGNGQIDINRQDYANALLRVPQGLQFDDGCDATLCQNFDPKQPAEACLTSCKNLFVPRLAENNPALKPANGECDNKTFSECLAWMDYDLGGSAPVKATLANGLAVLVQPGKDGAVYLLDAKHLGKQYHRLPITDICGTTTDPCKASWMGMIVTQPVVTYLDKIPIVIVPTFVPDNSHAAGVVALKIVMQAGIPQLQKLWQFPEPSHRKAIQAFRSHPSFPAISVLPDTDASIVWVVDIGNPGTLYGIRVNDGKVLIEQALLGAGRQLSAPIVYNNTIYLVSMMPSTGKSMIEAYHINKANIYLSSKFHEDVIIF